MLYIAIIVYLVVCYFIVSMFFSKRKGRQHRVQNTIIATLFLAISCLAAFFFWDYTSRTCSAQESPVTIAQLTGKWKTKYDMMEINPNRTFRIVNLKNPKLEYSGTIIIEGSIVTLVDPHFANEGWKKLIEICESDEKELTYHEFDRNGGNNDFKTTASRIQ